MPRSYWLTLFAIVGWLVLWSQPPRAQGVPSPSPSPKEQTDKGTASSPPKQQGVPVIIIETPEQAKASQSRENEGREHDAKDLDAQVRAADAAEKQILPTWLAAIFSLIGTVLLVWNLWESRRAVEVSKLAVSAAEANNAVTKKIGQAQVRAYLTCTGGSYVVEPDGLRYEIRLQNKGQSPAINIDFIGKIQIYSQGEWNSENPMQAITFTEFEDRGYCGVIAAGETESGRNKITFEKLAPEIKQLLYVKYHPFIIYCRIYWNDVFDDRFELAVRIYSRYSARGLLETPSMKRQGELFFHNKETSQKNPKD